MVEFQFGILGLSPSAMHRVIFPPMDKELDSWSKADKFTFNGNLIITEILCLLSGALHLMIYHYH
ncbi:MAG: hypothetical protein CVU41_14640 [Chloroflexi bacterium HGW-Chloroflexi-3]|nr:MAG: hypothetical protein CVU41_14640 [Chloroflexi bacterium HGW-Chloroflexi-3]